MRLSSLLLRVGRLEVASNAGAMPSERRRSFFFRITRDAAFPTGPRVSVLDSVVVRCAKDCFFEYPVTDGVRRRRGEETVFTKTVRAAFLRSFERKWMLLAVSDACGRP